MNMERGMRVLGLLIVMVLVGGIFLLVASANEKMLGTDTQENSGMIFEISGFTHALKTDVSSSDSTEESLSDEYGELNIPLTVERYDIVQFSEIHLNTIKNNSLKVTIYGEVYDMHLERMNFEAIDDGIDSYSGSIDGLDDSVAIFTFDRNLVQGSVQLRDEMVFITPVQNRENSLKTTMPLHIVYSSKDMKQS
ncbi:hypothetical protein L0665_00555 [Methanogenium marinum]|uniref:Uncharacterized protein n=1 Tax=Methanogenium marinum TaxID=348610 RepID=A0A9Q4KS05_9EURY|nr:hypothetical protein [Methanogenium marinum]MDE4907118.1 hypothetical protein [Methanogenium marinum]